MELRLSLCANKACFDTTTDPQARMDDLFGDEPEQPHEQEQEQAEQEQAIDLADDLFGDEEITAPPSGQQQAIAPSFSSFLQDVPLSAEELKHRQELEYEEQYDPAQYAPLDQEMPGGSRRIADVMFMNLPRPASKGAVRALLCTYTIWQKD